MSLTFNRGMCGGHAAAESPAEQQVLGPYWEVLPPTPSKPPEIAQADREAQIRSDLNLAYRERWAEAVARKWKNLPGATPESAWFDYVLNDLECQYWRSLSSP